LISFVLRRWGAVVWLGGGGGGGGGAAPASPAEGYSRSDPEQAERQATCSSHNRYPEGGIARFSLGITEECTLSGYTETRANIRVGCDIVWACG
jgi:hypothetical protein